MRLDGMTAITNGSYTGGDLFCKNQHQTVDEQNVIDHDRDWIIGCLQHDGFIHTHRFDKANQIILDALSAEARPTGEWIPLSYDDYGLGTDFPYERDGEWVIVTDGKTISVERIKKDAYDHFFPNGRWFELEDVIAWMPMPEPYKEDNDGKKKNTV